MQVSHFTSTCLSELTLVHLLPTGVMGEAAGEDNTANYLRLQHLPQQRQVRSVKVPRYNQFDIHTADEMLWKCLETDSPSLQVFPMSYFFGCSFYLVFSFSDVSGNFRYFDNFQVVCLNYGSVGEGISHNILSGAVT